MFRTLYLGNLLGARIYIHWTFWILAIFIFLSTLSQGVGVAVSTLGFVLAVFACVFLHEVGHAAAARAFGRRTHDITLLPIGGIARIEGGAMSPTAEGWIALAGPMTNLVIALSLSIGVSLSSIGSPTDALKMIQLTPAQQLIAANLALAIFNMIPAFPLDGGRVLKSVLCYWFPPTSALRIASCVGQWASGLLLLSSLVWWNFMGILFGLILFLVNTAQRFQSQWVVTMSGTSSGGPTSSHSPFEDIFPSSDPFANPSPGNLRDAKTIDAIDVREVQ